MNIAGLVVLVIFYLVILVVGILAARKQKASSGQRDAMESSIVARRDIGTVVGVFTMTGKLLMRRNPESFIRAEVAMESSIVARRDIGTVVGVFTMTNQGNTLYD